VRVGEGGGSGPNLVRDNGGPPPSREVSSGATTPKELVLLINCYQVG